MVIGQVQNDKNDKEKNEKTDNVVAAIDWDEQDGNDKLYHWILAVESNGDADWQPLNTEDIVRAMEEHAENEENEDDEEPAAEHPPWDPCGYLAFLEESGLDPARDFEENPKSSDDGDKSSGPPGLDSSDDEPAAEHYCTETSDEDSDFEKLVQDLRKLEKPERAAPQQTKAWKRRKRAKEKSRKKAAGQQGFAQISRSSGISSQTCKRRR